MDSNPHITVKICTSPFGTGEARARCEDEKRAWVRAHLGPEWLQKDKFLCTKNKTQVRAALLIDDKPDPTTHWKHGGGKASWTHVVFTQPFNEHVKGKPRLNRWSDWQQVIQPLLEAIGRGRSY